VLFDGMKTASDSLHAATVSINVGRRVTQKRKMYQSFKRLGLKLKIYDQNDKQTLFLLSNAA
jgi:hypothetical protein